MTDTPRQIDFARVNAIAMAHLPAICVRLMPSGKRQGNEWIAKNPTRHDRSPGSFKINLKSGLWKDFATNESGGQDPTSLVGYLEGCSTRRAALLLSHMLNIDGYGSATGCNGEGTDDSRFAPLVDGELERQAPLEDAAGATGVCIDIPLEMIPRPSCVVRTGAKTTIWPYLVTPGSAKFLVYRTDYAGGRKDFKIRSRWRSEFGAESWEWRRPPAPLPLYKLLEILARPDAPVVLAEGEKATDAAATIFSDHVVTCWQGGANAVDLTDFTPLRGRNVTIWPDNDEAGRAAGSALVSILLSLDCKVSVIDVERASAVVPGRPGELREAIPKWDAADAVGEWQDLASLRLALDGLTAEPATPSAYKSHGRFRMESSGLYVSGSGGSGRDGRSLVSAPFEILGRTRSPEGDGWGKLLRWKDEDGREHRVFVSDAELHGPVGPLVSRLAAEGLRIERSRGNDLAEYLNGRMDLEAIVTVDRTGWHEVDGNRVFVLPGRTLGNLGGKQIVLTSHTTAEFGAAGSLADWMAGVGTLVRGHSRHMLAVAAAFAGPLLGVLGRDGSGISFFGRSSIGKTAGILGGGSIWGPGALGGFVRTWRNTANGLEGAAALHNDVLLALDEFGQIEARDAAVAVYQIAGGTGKGRATKEGTLKRPQSWRTFVLSTGEIRLQEKLREDNRRITAGQTVRLLEVPADAGKGFGSFDHGGETGNARHIAEAIKSSARKSYGTAGPEFVSRLIEKGTHTIPGQYDDFSPTFRERLVPKNADGQVQRAAGTFALVGFAGELATSLGVLPWQKGDSTAAAETCFQAWLAERGGTEAFEIREVVERLTAFIGRYGVSRFSRLPGIGDGWVETLDNRAGFWRDDGADRQWLFNREVWRSEVFAGLDENAVATILRDKGWLVSNAKNQMAAKVAGIQSRFYAVQPGATPAGGDPKAAETLLL